MAARTSLICLCLILAAALLPTRQRQALEGEVLGPAGPIVGAVVRVPGQQLATHTDREGAFRLPHPGSARRITAWKEGFLIGGSSLPGLHLQIRLEPLPSKDDPKYVWVDPTPVVGDDTRCGNCHGAMHEEWRRSGHARSVAGRHFLGLYEGRDWQGRPGVGGGVLTDRPDASGVCAACHAPTVRDEDPAIYDLRQVKGAERLGVHCDYCHKVVGPGKGEVGFSHGRFQLELLRPRAGQLFFGPLDDVARGEDAYSPLYRHSRYCAACHEGTVLGVHVYSTYSEWRQSPAARAGVHCQDCHMKPTGRMTNIAPGHGGLERDPRTLANHTFWDGSQFAMLQRCLGLEVDLARGTTGIECRVRLVAEGVGHRVPTGFLDRQVILVVEARDGAGTRKLARSGPLLPIEAGAEMAGASGRLHARVLRDEGRGPIPFWKGPGEMEDTRLIPGHPVDSTFEFPTEVATIRVRVLHRRFWAETERRKGWPSSDLLVIDRNLRVPNK